MYRRVRCFRPAQADTSPWLIGPQDERWRCRMMHRFRKRALACRQVLGCNPHKHFDWCCLTLVSPAPIPLPMPGQQGGPVAKSRHPQWPLPFVVERGARFPMSSPVPLSQTDTDSRHHHEPSPRRIPPCLQTTDSPSQQYSTRRDGLHEWLYGLNGPRSPLRLLLLPRIA